MSDWPSTLLPPLSIISPLSEEALGSLTSTTNTPSSQTVVQNQAHYFPFRLDVEATAVKMCATNGATSNGNVDVGIYDDQFNYLISSGATAQGTVSILQEYDITDTVLPPGVYWMAISSSSATATFHTVPMTDEISLSRMPVYVQASAHPLPTTVAAPIKSTATSPVTVLLMGVAFDTLI